MYSASGVVSNVLEKNELDLKPVSSLNTNPNGPETRLAKGEIPGACEKQANSQLQMGKLCELNCFNMCIGKAAVQG